MPPQKLTNEMITAAIEGFEAQKVRIDSQIAELRGMLGGLNSDSSTGTTPRLVRRKVSAAGRRRIAEAQRKRWAALKRSGEAQASPKGAKPKRKLSAAGRAKIAAAAKKRWAKIRAERQNAV